MERYEKNIDISFTPETQSQLLTKNIAVIGCGGQGGYILEFLARLGINSIHFWDGDFYTLSNLNRQTGCTESTIGLNKATVMLNRLMEINSTINYNSHSWYFGEKNEDILEALSCDMIIMAADNSYNINQTRQMVRLIIEKKNIPCIDEWIRGLGGEISIIDQNNLELFDNHTKIWNMQEDIKNDPNILSSQPAYKCAIIAAETINQMVQYFTHNSNASLNSTLAIDLYHHKYYKYDKFGTI